MEAAEVRQGGYRLQPLIADLWKEDAGMGKHYWLSNYLHAWNLASEA